MSVQRAPIPDRTIVLTFDDGSISQLQNAAPLLKKLNFGATFFVTEGLKIPEERLLPKEKRTFMTWDEVRELHDLAPELFEIANHTQTHSAVSNLDHDALVAELEAIDQRCVEHGLPRTTSFCYPGCENFHSLLLCGATLLLLTDATPWLRVRFRY